MMKTNQAFPRIVRRVALLLAFAPLPAAAEVRVLELAVDGLACPFCAYGLEKHLRGLPAVGSLEIRLKEGEVLLTAKPGASLSLAAVRQAVVDAGFTWGDGTVTATGTLRVREGRPLLEADPEQSFLLPAGASPPVTAVTVTGRIGKRALGRNPAPLTAVRIVPAAAAERN